MQLQQLEILVIGKTIDVCALVHLKLTDKGTKAQSLKKQLFRPCTAKMLTRSVSMVASDHLKLLIAACLPMLQ